MSNSVSLMQKVLGSDWELLPPVIQRHYQIVEPEQAIVVSGKMTIDYPRWLTPMVKVLRLCGGLVDLKGENLAVEVKKWQSDNALSLYWQRQIQDAQGNQCVFASRMMWSKERGLVEFIKFGFGIRLKMSVEQGKLIYRSNGHVLKLGKFMLPIPDVFALGHAFISEEAIDADSFRLHFEIVHPLWGRTYFYGGIFNVLQE